MEFLRSLLYTLISSANNDTLTSYFPVWVPLTSFSRLIALARNLNTIMNIKEERGHLCLVLDFSGIALSFSPFTLMLAIGLLFIAFIIFRYGP